MYGGNSYGSIPYGSNGGSYGVDVNDEINSEIIGSSQENTEINSQVTGIGIPTEINSEIRGKSSNNSEINSEITGQSTENTEINSEITGASSENTEINSEITGKSLNTTEINSEIIGSSLENSDINSELIGGTLENTEINSEMEGGIKNITNINSEITGKAFLEIERTYRIIVKDADGNIQGEFDQFRSLKFGKRLNNYGTASFEIPVSDEKASELVALRKYTVWIYYQMDGTSTLVWSGEQAMREGSLDNEGNNWCTIYCFDWLEQLNGRYTVAEKRYENIDAGEIAWNLINETQTASQDNEFTVPDAAGVGSFIGNTYHVYQSFKRSEEFNLNRVGLYAYSEAVSGNVQFNLYHDNAGVPGNLVQGSDVSVDVSTWTGASYTLRYFTFDYPLLLKANTTYWIGIIGDGLVAGESANIIVNFPANQYVDGQTWFEEFNDEGDGGEMNGNDMRFYLDYETRVTATNNDFGITLGTIGTTMDRDRTYYNQNIMEAIVNLSGVISGFDFEITNDKVFNASDVIGVDRTNEIILEYGHNMESVQIVEDFVHPVNRAIVLGQSTDDLNDLVRVERNNLTSQAEFRLREDVLSEMNVSETDTMEEKGDAMLRKYENPLIKIDMNMASVQNPNITEFGLGDAVTLIIKSGVYNIQSDYRVFEWEVTYNDANADHISLILGNFTY